MKVYLMTEPSDALKLVNNCIADLNNDNKDDILFVSFSISQENIEQIKQNYLFKDAVPLDNEKNREYLYTLLTDKNVIVVNL